MDRFYYLINDAQQNVLGLKAYELEVFNNYSSAYKDALQKVIISDPLLKMPFRQLRLAVGYTNNVFLPDELYHPGHQSTYLNHLTQVPEDAEFNSDDLRKMGVKNVYWLEQGVYRLLKSYFSNARFFHCTTPVIYGFQRIAEHLSGPALFLNVVGQNVQLVLFDSGKFQFSNIFSFYNSRDFIYYVMLIYDQFQLKPETVPVYIAGHIVEDSEIYHLLYRYIRHLNMIQVPDYLHFDKKHSKLPAHFYFDLYSIKLCE